MKLSDYKGLKDDFPGLTVTSVMKARSSDEIGATDMCVTARSNALAGTPEGMAFNLEHKLSVLRFRQGGWRKDFDHIPTADDIAALRTELEGVQEQ